MAAKTIKVGSNGLRLEVHHGGSDPHLALRQGRLRPAVRIDKADLVHLRGLLTIADGAGLEHLVTTHEVLSRIEVKE